MREGMRSGSRRRTRERSQATLEFAFVLPLFLVCFLASVDAGLWAVQNSAEVSAVEQAARAGAAAGAQPLGAPPPDARSVTSAVLPRLRQALFATRVVPWCDPSPGSACAPATAACSGSACTYATCPATPAAVEAVFGARTVAICVEEHAPPACSASAAAIAPSSPYCADTPTVTVRLVGHVASLVPPGFGLGVGGEIPADIGATTHTLRFAP